MQQNKFKRRTRNTRAIAEDNNFPRDIPKLINEGLPYSVGFYFNKDYVYEDYKALAIELNTFIEKEFPEEYNALRFNDNDNVQTFIFQLMEIYNSKQKEIDYNVNDFELLFEKENKTLYESELVDFSFMLPTIIAIEQINEIKNKKLRILFAFFYREISYLSETSLLTNHFEHYYEAYYQMELENVESEIEYNKQNEDMLEEWIDRKNILEQEYDSLNILQAKYQNEFDKYYKKYTINDLKNMKFRSNKNKEIHKAMLDFILMDTSFLFSKLDERPECEGNTFYKMLILVLAYQNGDEINDNFIEYEVQNLNESAYEPLFLRKEIRNGLVDKSNDSIKDKAIYSMVLLEKILELLRDEYYT